jgi:hypothetical protein
VKIIIVKPIAGNEEFRAEVDDALEVDKAIEERLAQAYRLMDARNWEMNRRVSAANTVYQELRREGAKGAEWAAKAADTVDDVFRIMFSQKIYQDIHAGPV